jgi:cob(I)alamin adenosyltransferase
MMKIYTKTGDDGTTSLFSGRRVSKTHLRVEAYGTVDEFSAIIGVVRANKPSEKGNEWLVQIQDHLFRLGADLATPLEAKLGVGTRIGEGEIEWLEEVIDEVESELPELKTFILPGGTLAAAHLHVGRTVCRRAERRAIELAAVEDIGPYVVKYLNRLSDMLFVLARWENYQVGIADEEWTADGKNLLCK